MPDQPPTHPHEGEPGEATAGEATVGEAAADEAAAGEATAREAARADALEPDPTADLLALAGTPGLVPAELRDVSFPVSLRGYDRTEVDAYVKRVNQVVAELEVSRSPQSAVKHALDRVGEQTAGVLQRAREAAEELSSTTLAEAEHASRRAHVEAAELMERADKESRELLERATEESDELLTRAHREAAERLSDAEARVAAAQAASEARLEELEGEIEEALAERRRVLEEIRATAAGLDAFAEDAEREGRRPGEDRGEKGRDSPVGDPRGEHPLEPATHSGADPGEQPTEVAPAIDSASGAIEPQDAEETPSQARRPAPTRPRQPRPPRRAPSEAEPGTRA